MSASPEWLESRSVETGGGSDVWELVDDPAYLQDVGGVSLSSSNRRHFKGHPGSRRHRRQRHHHSSVSPRVEDRSGGGGGPFFVTSHPTLLASSPRGHTRTASPRRLGLFALYSPFGGRRHRRRNGRPGLFACFSSLSVSPAMGLAELGSTGPLSSHLLDWRVPSLSAEQDLLQQLFATAYTDACYRCLISQDAAVSFGPNETLQLVVDQWRADAFDESQDTLRRVVEQYHHDLLRVVKSVVDAEDAAVMALAGETAGTEEGLSGVSMNAAISASASVSSSATSLYQAFTSVGQANTPATIDSPAVQKAVLHYAMPALGRVLVHRGFFLCFWYSSTGEKIGQLEYRACRWVLEAHVPHVHVPLCYHFRYKGRGVTAISLTPIGENLTTVTEQNAEVAALAQQLASVFSLLPYGSSPGQAAAAAAATRERSSGSLSDASFASVSAGSVDGEAVPDVYFLPRSVQAHFAQDGRYYFLRNSQWFTPWLNSRPSCDAAVQRLSYVNPHLLAVCGVQVSCRACQRDAFMEENRVALEFMRHEVDVGIPQLLQDEQGFFAQRMLRRRRRAAARRLQMRRVAHAAAEAEAARHSTRILIGSLHSSSSDSSHSRDERSEDDGLGEEEAAYASSPPSSLGVDASEGESSGEDWTEVGESGDDDDDLGSEGEAEDAAHAAARRGRAIPTALLPFTTTSVVSRFSARGYPKSLLGVLLLALLQYPAAPLHMVREVKREILFRGLKGFIRTCTYEARFGVEQLLGRLPHERANEEDAASAFVEASEQLSEGESEGETIYADTPLHEDEEEMEETKETPYLKRDRFEAASLSVHGSGSISPAASRKDACGTQSSPWRLSVDRSNNSTTRQNTGNSVRGDNERNTTNANADDINISNTGRGGLSNPLTRASVVSPSGGTAPPSFTQRWQQQHTEVQRRRRQSHAVNALACAGTTAAAAAAAGASAETVDTSTDADKGRQSLLARLRRRLSDLWSSWVGGIRGGVGAGCGGAGAPRPSTSTAEDAEGNVLAGTTTAAQRSPRQDLDIANPLAAIHATSISNSSTSHRRESRSVLSSFALSSGAAASNNHFSSWADFSVTTERVLAAFMQYDGTARPSCVFCDAPRRLDELAGLRERGLSATAGGSGDLSDSFSDVAPRARTAQRMALEASLWSSADMLNRLYVERVLPYIYRKFRLSARRTGILHVPLNEEDRASVYVRLLDALGVSIEDGAVQQIVPVVMDFAPRCIEVPAATAANRMFAESGTPLVGSHTPSSDGGSGDGNPLQWRRQRQQQRGTATPASSSPHSAAGSAERSGGGGVGGPSWTSTQANAASTHTHTPNGKAGGGRATKGAFHDSMKGGRATAPATVDVGGTTSSPLSTSVRELHYRFPSWIVCRATALVQGFLARSGEFAPQHRRYFAPAAAAHTDRRGGRRVLEGDANVSSAQVAGLVPLLALVYNAPRTAFAATQHRPPLPPWPQVASRLLAQLRAVSVTPHLLWDALELYELVDLRTLQQEARADCSLSPLGLATSRPSASLPHMGSENYHENDEGDEQGDDAVERKEKEDHSTEGLEETLSTPCDSLTGSLVSLPQMVMTDRGLPAPCCALALALLLRRRTLRSASDRTMLIQLLRRYVAALRAFPAVLCSFMAPLHGSDDHRRMMADGMTSSVNDDDGDSDRGGSLRGLTRATAAAAAPEKERQAQEWRAAKAGVESEAVYTAVLSTLQEVLLNSDLLLAHFGNPFSAQYRLYTADLVGYLEYNMNTIAAAARLGVFRDSNNNSNGSNVRKGSSGSATERGGEARSGSGEDIHQRLHSLRDEIDSTLQHIWNQLLIYCKPDSMGGKDALQRAVALFRMQEAGTLSSVGDSSDGSCVRASAANNGVSGDTGTVGSGGRDSRRGGQTADAAAAAVVLRRDPEVETALQRACDVLLTTEGSSSPVTLRAYCNTALYWYSVGCEAEWRESLQRLRRLWREGGPEDIRQLLTTVFTVSNYSVGMGGGGGGGGAASMRTSAFGSHGADGSAAALPSAVAQNSATSRRTDLMPKSLTGGQSHHGEDPPIPFLQRVCRD